MAQPAVPVNEDRTDLLGIPPFGQNLRLTRHSFGNLGLDNSSWQWG